MPIKNRTPKQNLTVRVPEELKNKFEQKTVEMDLSMGHVIRKLMEDWLKKNQQPSEAHG